MTDLRLLAAQAAAMAHPDRLRLLALVLTDPSSQPTAAHLAGSFGNRVAIVRHLEAMADVWLLARVGDPRTPGYRPTADAIVRFGGAAIGSAPDGDRPVVDAGNHKQLMDRVVDELTDRFSETFGRETVERFVRESYGLLADRASVQRYLPALTARFATDRLTALAAPFNSADTPGSKAISDILFVCVHNSGRSQIAAAALRSLVGNRVRVRTAGSTPAGMLDPGVRAELARRGLDRLAEIPRPLTEEVVRASGLVVTMGCGDACPVLPGRRYVDWPVEDPAGRSSDEVRRIADEIIDRVHVLLAEIDAGLD
ncbi:three-helix bundle dimerization domain-containing protein [Promicromonospora sp. NPDC023987]|uniref:arsenate-mycothiol transferase ArsC n=1 Tax=Promicromonospora sp. NPDC023987 TaxID=3155360 RepID=UPI0033C8A99C